MDFCNESIQSSGSCKINFKSRLSDIGKPRKRRVLAKGPSVRQKRGWRYCVKRALKHAFLYLGVLGRLFVFSRVAQTIAWIWMSRRAHPSFYFLRCDRKHRRVCQKLCLFAPSCPSKFTRFPSGREIRIELKIKFKKKISR